MPNQIRKAGPNRLAQLTQPVAIAMWDFTWLLRHQRLAEFENWDQVLDGLVERGYNAIRIDAFPHLVAADPTGQVTDEFFHAKTNWHPMPWGNKYSVTIRPREALLEFLPKCQARGIQVGLATWFPGGTNRNEAFTGVAGFVRAWDETLTFLQQNGLLDNILYVDVLNEYPLWHGFQWLTNELAKRKTTVPAAAQPDAPKQDAFMWAVGEPYNETQKEFHREFITQALQQLAAKWPQLDFFASLAYSWTVPWQDVDLSRFAALDMHVWFVHNRKFSETTSYFDLIHKMVNDVAFAGCYRQMLAYWQDHKAELTQWMDNELGTVAAVGRQYHIPCGNTEGWGSILWMEHPDLDWRFIKEAGEICARLAVNHGYKFICTSNCTHPQFPGLWNDVAWHRKVTAIIRGS